MLKKKNIYELLRAGIVCEPEIKKKEHFQPLPPEAVEYINNLDHKKG